VNRVNSVVAYSSMRIREACALEKKTTNSIYLGKRKTTNYPEAGVVVIAIAKTVAIINS